MDPKILSAVGRLSNQELLVRVKSLAEGERRATAALIAHLAELDERRLYLAEGCSSLFTYCTQVLHLSEHAAYRRIEAARLVRRFPVVLERLEEGSVNLTTVGLLAAYLTPENHGELLDMARHQSKRQIEELLARLRPQPPVSASVRRLPTARHHIASPPSDDVAGLLLTEDGKALLRACPLPSPCRPERVPPSSLRWLPSATRCSLRRAPRLLRSSGAPRRSCAIRSRTGIRQRSSIGR